MKILDILKPNNTLSVNRPLAHALGVNVAIIYAALVAKQAYYEEHEMLDEDGFFYSTISDLEESTALSRAQQQRALGVLEDAGLIEFCVKGTPAKRYFRVIDNEILLASLLACEISADKFAENSQTSLQKTDIPVCEKVTNKFAENSQSSLSENENPIYKTKESKSKINNPNRSIAPERGLTEGMTERENYLSLIHENIEYDCFSEKEKVDELVGIMVDVICSTRKTARVNGGELPIEKVRKRFLELNKAHIEHVLNALKSNTSEVRNIRAYLITALYNAPAALCNFQPKSNSTIEKEEPRNSSFGIEEVMKKIRARYEKCSDSG